MRGVNHVWVMGNLGHDPEPRRTPNGKLVCELRIAATSSKRDGDSWVDDTTWVRAELWDQQAETAAKFLRKGSPVGIEGALREDSWTDKEGRRRSRSFVRTNRLHLLPDRNAAQQSAG